MKHFAVVKNGIVDKILVAESLEIANDVTGEECIEYTDENPAYLGEPYIDGIFQKPSNWVDPGVLDTSGDPDPRYL